MIIPHFIDLDNINCKTHPHYRGHEKMGKWDGQMSPDFRGVKTVGIVYMRTYGIW